MSAILICLIVGWVIWKLITNPITSLKFILKWLSIGLLGMTTIYAMIISALAFGS